MVRRPDRKGGTRKSEARSITEAETETEKSIVFALAESAQAQHRSREEKKAGEKENASRTWDSSFVC